MTNHKRYTVRYRDAKSNSRECCYYASDAYEARVLAMESVRYIHDLSLIHISEPTRPY